MSRRRTPLLTGMVLFVALAVGIPAAALAAYTALGSGTSPAIAAMFPPPGTPTVSGNAGGLTVTWTGTQLSTGRSVDGYEVRRTVGATTTVVCTTTTALICSDSPPSQAATYRVVAKVGGWTSTSGTRTYTPDTTAPTAAIAVQPGVNSLGWVQSNSPQITVTATDAGSGVASVSYKIGTAAAVTTNGDDVTFNLSQQGSVTIQYWARDNAGNVAATKSTTLKIDGTPPPLSGLKISHDTGSSATDFITSAASQTVSGTSESGAAISATYNGTTRNATANGSGAWSMTFTLADGARNAVVTATDQAGNTVSATQSIRLDTTAPSATVSDPDSGVDYSDAAWNGTCASAGGPGICGTATDGSGSGVASVTYKLERDPWIGATTCFNGSGFSANACNSMRAIANGPSPWWASVPTNTIPNSFIFTSTMRLTITVTDVAGNARTSVTTFYKY